MNTLFKHFVLTRFNLVDWDGYEVSYDYVNSDAYLSERFRLFELFCLPSVNNQTNKNFTWFVLFNDKLPEKWKKKSEGYKQICPNMEIRYMTAVPEGGWKNMINSFVINELKSLEIQPQYVLTTRIDNDDAFHLSFVDTVQKYFLEHQEEAVLNFSNGLQYIPQYNVLKNTTYPNSHFCTLMAKNNKDLQTALSFPHTDLPSCFKAIFLKTKKRMWLEVIHSTNVINTAFFQLRNLPNDLFFIGFKHRNLEAFGVKQNITRFNFGNLQLFFRWFFGKCREKIIGR